MPMTKMSLTEFLRQPTCTGAPRATPGVSREVATWNAGTNHTAAVAKRLARHSILLMLVLSACASIPGTKPEPPVVTLASVRPVSLSMLKQQLAFRLRVSNPNRFDLPLEALNLTARFAGEDFATGESAEEVTIPARGEGFVDVMVDAGLAQVLTRFSSMLDEGTLSLDYGVSGTVKLANWPRLIPFDADGVLDNPMNPDKPDDLAKPATSAPDRPAEP